MQYVSTEGTCSRKTAEKDIFKFSFKFLIFYE